METRTLQKPEVIEKFIHLLISTTDHYNSIPCQELFWHRKTEMKKTKSRGMGVNLVVTALALKVKGWSLGQ